MNTTALIRRSASAQWTDLDRTADPAAAVDYLDAVGGQTAVQAYKQESIARLRLRPGDRVLDAGCGAGVDALALARIVAPHGRVVGVDTSAVMVDEARRRAHGTDLPVAFQVGDLHGLPFRDGTFNGARADRVFQHLADPERALAELVRVTRPGGRIVVADTDWGTLAVDAPDAATTSAVLAEVAGAIRHPWMGRQLYGLFRRAGLVEVSVLTGAGVVTDYATADRIFRLGEGVQRAREHGAVTEAAATAWTRSLREAMEADRFCCSVTGFIVAGRRPSAWPEGNPPRVAPEAGSA